MTTPAPLPPEVGELLAKTCGVAEADLQRATCEELTALADDLLGNEQFDLARCKKLGHAVGQQSLFCVHFDGLRCAASLRLYAQLEIAAQDDSKLAPQLTSPDMCVTTIDGWMNAQGKETTPKVGRH